MKSYDKAIKFFARKRAGFGNARVGDKHTLDYIDALDDAIECLERCNPKQTENHGGYVKCPGCNAEYTAKNAQEFTHGARICGKCGQAFKW